MADLPFTALSPAAHVSPFSTLVTMGCQDTPVMVAIKQTTHFNSLDVDIFRWEYRSYESEYLLEH